MSAYLDPTRDARSCARQIRNLARVNALTGPELNRLLGRIEDDLETISEAFRPEPAPVIEGKFVVANDGGRK